MPVSPARGAQNVPELSIHGTVAGIMAASVPIVSAVSVAADVRRQLETRRFEFVDVVLILDGDGRYVGAVPIADALGSSGELRMAEIVRKDWPAIHPQWSQEHAAQAAAAAGVTSLPVISDDGRPLGCIPASRLLGVLAREHREDVHRLVGMLREREDARHALEDPPLRRVAHRLPWLLAGLVLSTGGAALMVGYADALRANIALSFFIPSLVYLTDAIGTQTEAIVVRGLSHRRSWSLGSLLAGEVITGTIIGLVLGALAFLGVLAAFHDIRLAQGVGLSMVIASAIATAIGLMLPWSLSRLDVDPAFGSGPVATIIQDILTILVYFVVMSHVMPAA